MTLSIAEKILTLQSAELFGTMPDQELTDVAHIAQEVTIRAGERFIRQGEPGDSLYLIVAGEAQVVRDATGEIARRGPTSLIGELAILWRQPRSANCVAVTDLTLLRIDRDDFWALMEAHPRLARGAIEVLIKHLNERTEDVQRYGGSALG
jgi:CRP-like cAMP-binding protein